MRRLLPFIFAGVLGFAAVGLTQNFLRQQKLALDREREKLYQDYRSPIDVIVAKHDVPEGKELTADDLALRAIPEKFIQPFATARAADLVGRSTIAPIAEGEQILRNKVRRPGEATGLMRLSEITPEGKRAVTMSADLISGVGGFVRPGDTVDVLWTFTPPAEGPASVVLGGGKQDTVTMTLFQGVSVLAVGNEMAGQTVSATAPMSGNRDYTLTLALTPQETALLTYARTQGTVQVSLRSEAEKGRQVAVAPANRTALLQAVLGKDAVLIEERRKEKTVEVFRGLERNELNVNE